jgi:hypothetical protein
MNLPPFYIGQKIVSLANFNHYKENGFNTPIEGLTYTVRGLRELKGINGNVIWCVDLIEIRNEIRTFSDGTIGEVSWSCTCFRGIEPLVVKLELTKVLEKVTEFVFTN